MRSRFDDDQGPDLKVVVAEYRDAMKKRLRWIGPIMGGFILLLLLWMGVYSVEPAEVGVVRTFGKEDPQHTQPGLHFIIPFVQQVDIVNIQQINREEVGFRTTPQGPKRVDSEALMLTGDENIIEAMMIVQYQIKDPSKYLFKLRHPEKTLHIAAEVALRGVVGQMRVTPKDPDEEDEEDAEEEQKEPEKKPDEETEDEEAEKEGDEEDEGAEDEEAEEEGVEDKDVEDLIEPEDEPEMAPPPSQDILTTGREHAQVEIQEKLQKLMDKYESGLHITEVKLQDVDAPDEVKDSFHDVVRAREEREQLINKAKGYRRDRLPKARGEAQKIIRAAEGYKEERVLRSEGEAARFVAVLKEYEAAKNVTRDRLHLETMERVLQRVPKKIVVDEDVADNSLPLLDIGGGNMLDGGGK